MISPVTSTSVATNGAELVAGSNPIRRRMNGNIDPDNDPHVTTPTSENNTVIPTRNQCGPYAEFACGASASAGGKLTVGGTTVPFPSSVPAGSVNGSLSGLSIENITDPSALPSGSVWPCV